MVSTWAASNFSQYPILFRSVSVGIYPEFGINHARAYLDEVANRLADVHVENMDFLQVISVYDSPETFFYCDPPYRNTKGGSSNYNLLSDEEWQVLHDTLRKIKGKFLLSSNADPYVVDLFKKFHIREIDVRVTLARVKKGDVRKEVLISDYSLPLPRVGHGRGSKKVDATPVHRRRGESLTRPAKHLPISRNGRAHS
ncbi:MAG: DNA adenine methylase [Bacteroidota bacterium]